MYGESLVSIAHLPHMAYFDRPKYIYIGFFEFSHLVQGWIHCLSSPFSIEEPIYSASSNQT